ncbi:MAG: glycosyltransferase family 1 protein [Flavobacterium sp.]|nr:MAG: glycosyltransferase family 1 protein [Flavobacterium sp.]
MGRQGVCLDMYQKYAYKRIKYFHVFSEYQLGIIKKILPGKVHYYAPLTLDDYGDANINSSNDKIRFLFFGYIKEYKRLDLLIRSFLDLRRSGFENIELIIAGNCENWITYKSLIGNDRNINSRIEVIPNRDIPNIVASCHYMVLPYQDSAQSAVLTLAYQYRKPVVVSNIEAFKQFVIEGETGFYFENGQQASLTNVLRNVIMNHEKDYSIYEEKIESFVQKEFALESILNKYRSFLNDSIQRESILC